MRSLKDKIEEYVSELPEKSAAGMWVRHGANFAIPLAKEEGFRKAIVLLFGMRKVEAEIYAKRLEQEGMRLGILPRDAGRDGE